MFGPSLRTSQYSKTGDSSQEDQEAPSSLLCSLQRLSTRLRAEKSLRATNGDAEPILSFDKDDVDTLDFVTAAANLRSQIFDIEQKSKFDVKRKVTNFIAKMKADER